MNEKMINELASAINNALSREVKIAYMVVFQLPTFAPGEEHGRDYVTLSSHDTRKKAMDAMDAHIALNANGVVFMRNGRKVHQYTQNGVYMGIITTVAREV